MLCEQCKVRRAEIHLVNVVNGERQVQHLCRECAEAHLHLDDVSNLLKMSFSVEGLMDIEEAFKELVIPALRGAYTRKRAARLCPHCGADRNVTDCDCDKKQIDPRFAALRALLDSDKGE